MGRPQILAHMANIHRNQYFGNLDDDLLALLEDLRITRAGVCKPEVSMRRSKVRLSQGQETPELTSLEPMRVLGSRILTVS